MIIIAWIIGILLALTVLYQLIKGVIYLINLGHTDGVLFAISLAILFILVIARVFIRDYAPQYVILANWVLILYVALPIAYRLFIKRGSN